MTKGYNPNQMERKITSQYSRNSYHWTKYFAQKIEKSQKSDKPQSFLKWWDWQLKEAPVLFAGPVHQSVKMSFEQEMKRNRHAREQKDSSKITVLYPLQPDKNNQKKSDRPNLRKDSIFHQPKTQTLTLFTIALQTSIPFTKMPLYGHRHGRKAKTQIPQ